MVNSQNKEGEGEIKRGSMEGTLELQKTQLITDLRVKRLRQQNCKKLKYKQKKMY